MTYETWLAFTVACVVLTLIPGPSVLLVIAQSLTLGKRAAMMCIVGDVIGGIVLMGLSYVGVGAILAASAVLFQIVKWAGVIYLAYLGYVQISQARSDTGGSLETNQASSAWGSLWAGAITAILNPKAIIFYMAFLAQFIDPAGDLVVQMAILTITSSMIIVILLAGYALLASRARQAFQSKTARKRMGYTGGTFMIGGSVLMATTR